MFTSTWEHVGLLHDHKSSRHHGPRSTIAPSLKSALPPQSAVPFRP